MPVIIFFFEREQYNRSLMSEFTHSIVLFTGDDGLPMVFNIQYATNKETLRSMIEFGGGLCTLSDDAIYLISTGTKVLNVDPSKQLLSSKYVYDCVNQNYLLETDEYRFEINEMETSDISDNSLNLVEQGGRKLSDDDNSLDLIDPKKTVSPSHLTCPASNHDFDFEDSENRTNFIGTNKKGDTEVCDAVLPDRPLENFASNLKEIEISDASNKPTPDSLEVHQALFNEENVVDDKECDMEVDEHLSNECSNNVINNDRDSPIHAVIVSSSQPHENALDQFDNMVLHKAQKNPTEKDDDCLSQSYTVSSSADAQVSPKVASNVSAEIFGPSPDAPDSASQTTERQQYIKDLEQEIEQILKKPSPKSIQDKTMLVKYICTVKKLAPAVVLQTLRNF